MAKPQGSSAPLTPETVTEAVEEVKWETLCSCLFVPNSKRDEIESQYPPNDRRRVLVDWWFSTDPAPSWRRLIQQLDMWCVTVTADRIRCNAEPIQDPTFTLRNVNTAVGSVQDRNIQKLSLGVPLRNRKSREGMLQYFITTVPNASWQTLAGGLYQIQEHAALRRVTNYFQAQPEATLTVANLCSMLEEVVEWDSLGYYLDVPALIRSEIKKKFSNDTQCKQAMLAKWRNHHPAPSWMLVANALYSISIDGKNGKYHKVLQLVKEKYLKAHQSVPALSGQPVSSTDTPSASPRKDSAADVLPTPQRGPVISPPPSQPPPSLKKFGLVEIEFSDLEFEGKVGSGGFGTVSKGRWISKNDIVAIKVLVELEEREVRILSSLDHPSIIHYYGTATHSNVHYIVTEFAENGSIYDYIFKQHKQPHLPRVKLWGTQIAEGMVYLHQQDIIHRDLKSSNVVLTSTLNAKICDLGSARSLEHTARQTTAVGTYAWMAPEMLRREKVSKSCDVYSYGVLLFEIATQQQPFPDVLPVLVPGMTMEGKRPSIPETCDSHLADLIKCCWKQDAKARPSFKEILITLSTSE